jgi:uncharacterized protein DUF4129
LPFLRSLALALLISAVAPSVASSQSAVSPSSDVRSVQGFQTELDRLITLIRSSPQAADAPAIAAQIPNRWRVSVGDQRVDVSTRWLTTVLTQAPGRAHEWPAAREALARRLEGIRDEATFRSGADTGETRVRARTDVQAILTRSEFMQSAVSRWREEARDEIIRWLDQMFSRLGLGAQMGQRMTRGLAWMVALLALGGLGFWLVRSLSGAPAPPLELGTAITRLRARELALRAIAEARAGNVREAVRLGYHAALVRMEEEGVFRMDDSRTPREYLRLMNTGDARQPLMLDLTRRFEQIWYGNRAVSPDDAPSVASHLEVLGCLRPGERAS